LNTFVRISLLVAVLILCTGCSGLVAVQGEVTLDGQPLPNAKVMFMPATGGRPAEGTSDANGKFRLTTNSPHDGVAAGEYVVTVTARTIQFEPKPGTAEGFVEKGTWHAPERYSHPSQSGLKATVAANQPQVKIELKSSP
jgi:hypothetical protein